MLRNFVEREIQISVSSPGEAAVLDDRLHRLETYFVSNFRRDGAILYPHSHKMEANGVKVKMSMLPGRRLAWNVLGKLSIEDRLVLMRSISFQLMQVHSAGYLLGEDLEDAIYLYKRHRKPAAALSLFSVDGGVLYGCFKDEADTLPDSASWDTPEAIRRRDNGFGLTPPPDEKEDVFILAKIAARVLSGEEVKTPPGFHSLAEAVTNLFPLSGIPEAGGLGRMIRRCFSPFSYERPMMDELFMAMCSVTEPDVICEPPLGIAGEEGEEIYNRLQIELEDFDREQDVFLEAPLNRVGAIPVRECRKAVNQYTLDMMMIELLEAVQALHDRGVLLCCVNEDSFACAEKTWMVRPNKSEAIHMKGFCLKGVPDHLCFLDSIPDGFSILADEGIVRTLSPEMLLHMSGTDMSEIVNEASDVFALGVFYHLLLTGTDLQGPCGEVPGQFLSYDRSGKASLGYAKGLDRYHKELMEKMLSFDPGDRPSCMEVVHSILDFYTVPAAKDIFGAGKPIAEMTLRKSYRHICRVQLLTGDGCMVFFDSGRKMLIRTKDTESFGIGPLVEWMQKKEG